MQSNLSRRPGNTWAACAYVRPSLGCQGTIIQSEMFQQMPIECIFEISVVYRSCMSHEMSWVFFLFFRGKKYEAPVTHSYLIVICAIKSSKLGCQELLKVGVLKIFDSTHGRAMFVSHQWTTDTHPDPEARQLKVRAVPNRWGLLIAATNQDCKCLP